VPSHLYHSDATGIDIIGCELLVIGYWLLVIGYFDNAQSLRFASPCLANAQSLRFALFGQCPMPNSQFPIPNAQCPIPNSQFPIS
jgi:hypothetical protein